MAKKQSALATVRSMLTSLAPSGSKLVASTYSHGLASRRAAAIIPACERRMRTQKATR